MKVSLSVLDPMIEGRSLLQHPFYVRWVKGALTLDDLRIYAKEYFHLVERVPGIVARVKDRLPKEQSRRFGKIVEENQREEVGHIDLWKRFAKSLGVSEAELRNHKPSSKARDAVERLEKGAEGSFEDAVTTMYALEHELPLIAKTKKDGLCRFYSLTNDDACCYFDEHEKEEKHLMVWREIPVDDARARQTAQSCLNAQHSLLDAVCELRAIPLHC